MKIISSLYGCYWHIFFATLFPSNNLVIILGVKVACFDNLVLQNKVWYTSFLLLLYFQSVQCNSNYFISFLLGWNPPDP